MLLLDFKSLGKQIIIYLKIETKKLSLFVTLADDNIV